MAVLAAAAAMACCVGAGAMAAAGFPWQSVFGQFFGPAAHSQAASLGMPGEGLALTATDNGCTLTLNGALFDGEVLYLPLTLTFENGVPAQGLTYYGPGAGHGHCGFRLCAGTGRGSLGRERGKFDVQA